MDFLSANYWNQRYTDHQTGWDLGQPSTPLKEYIEKLASRMSEEEKNRLSVLIPGAGNAHEAVLMHELGFKNVTVLDFAQQALDNLLELCPTFSPDHLICQDFFEHDGQYDLVLEQTFFCAIDPKLRTSYVQKMKELLAPQGKLVGVLFDRQFEGGPPFGGNKEAYSVLFEKYFSQVSIKPCYNSVQPRMGSEVFIQIQK